MKARSRKTYFLKRTNDERRSKGLPAFNGRAWDLLSDAESDFTPFDNGHAQFLADFMNTVEARQGRMVKRFDALLAKRLLLKLMKAYNHLVFVNRGLLHRVRELEEGKQ